MDLASPTPVKLGLRSHSVRWEGWTCGNLEFPAAASGGVSGLNPTDQPLGGRGVINMVIPLDLIFHSGIHLKKKTLT